MRKFNSLSLLLLAFTFIAASCTKEGPEGPVGATGAQGPPGTTGATGAPGTPGAGITTYSTWYTTVAADWVTTAPVAQYTATLRYDRSAPGVTQAIIDNGIVLVYMKNWRVAGFPRATETVQLPYFVDINFVDFYDYVIPAAGTIRHLYKSYDPWGAADLAGTQYRYVLISGSVAGGRGENSVTTYGGFTAEELKAMPYEEVARRFNIPESGTNIQ
jgi:hypothetical protein